MCDFWQCKYCDNWNKSVYEICMKCWRDKSGIEKDANFVEISSHWCLPKYIPAYCGNCGHYFGNIFYKQNIPYHQCPGCNYINVYDIAFSRIKYK